MQIFYSNQIEKNHLVLDETESHHCTRVLRKKEGDTIEIVDGKGKYFRGTIDEAGKKVKVRIDYETERLPERKHRIHLAIAPTKNLDRMEWMIEKATEIGVDEISFLICENSERKVLKLDRLYKKAMSAMKQSGQAVLPQLNELRTFRDTLKNIAEKGRVIAHLDSAVESVPLNKMTINEDTMVLVGPEGGFSPGEVSVALHGGFLPVTMGTTRLRTETAGIVACTILNGLFV